ncbi:MAG: glycosyltransferase [Candidatus Krumholzibacteriia bacterium]
MSSDPRRSIKVAHVLRSLDFGGAEKLVLDLARFQRQRQDVESSLVCCAGLGPLEDTARSYALPYVSVGGRGIPHVSVLARLIAVFRRERPDIVHTHNFFSHVHGAVAARMTGIPVIHTKHGRAVSSLAWSPALRRRLYRLADKIVVVSNETGEIFRRRSGVEAGRIVVIRNGIDFNRYNGPGRKEVLGAFGIAGSAARVFGSVSRLNPVKDHATMIRAFGEVVRDFADCALLIVGDGPERGAIERLVRELQLESRVILVGFTNDIPKYLAAMDAFLQPSREEGLSLTILEAAAAGVPVIATPVGGTPEIISNGETGTFIPVGDVDALAGAMRSFLAAPEPFKQMALRLKTEVETAFSTSRMAECYRTLYLDVLAERGKR